jgi:hypothetical protein
MQKRITITVVGIAIIPEGDHRDLDVIDVLAQALSEHFPEFQADPHHPPIMVTVEDLPAPSGSSAVSGRD